ncbi:hypothetical protein CDAR_554471 [Caerostris darwini]|uniref:Uncharacterized protein n=1 Tax=Caerostris darwini TaxID=1538125 RepID=A0AAV4SMS4_9ARAC|nr:hypothetical protein CDAR_554471 [Caerostris darwini]
MYKVSRVYSQAAGGSFPDFSLKQHANAVQLPLRLVPTEARDVKIQEASNKIFSTPSQRNVRNSITPSEVPLRVESWATPSGGLQTGFRRPR